jgi:hypothetical protein
VLCGGERELRLEPTNEGTVTESEAGSLELREVENKGKTYVAIYCFSFLPEFCPENGGCKFFSNVGAYLPSYTVPHCSWCLLTGLHRTTLQLVPIYRATPYHIAVGAYLQGYNVPHCSQCLLTGLHRVIFLKQKSSCSLSHGTSWEMLARLWNL